MWRAYTTGLHGCSCTGVFHDSSSCIYIPVHVCVVSSHYCKDAVGSLHWPGHTKQILQIDQFPNTLSLCLWQHTQVTLLLSYSSKSMLYAWHTYMHTLFHAGVGLLRASPNHVTMLRPCWWQHPAPLNPSLSSRSHSYSKEKVHVCSTRWKVPQFHCFVIRAWHCM